eukprot:CAMPEP_0119300806 /NCGR_PEP_ID=MMETSP1333-20130426/2707_1 /TAXON_ID=418940 /ORGANISM="Scyphosphaera apsteinii, Strain RCC1455" /LENGTH=48 /DNA_ID= /DNA_START= /DNA_END= /DNA_ORIENTATION=
MVTTIATPTLSISSIITMPSNITHSTAPLAATSFTPTTTSLPLPTTTT